MTTGTEPFLADDLVRAGTFFVLAFAAATVGGFALGETRLGLRMGVLLGLVFAAFAYLFVRPSDAAPGGDDGRESTAVEEGERDPGPEDEGEGAPGDEGNPGGEASPGGDDGEAFDSGSSGSESGESRSSDVG